MAWALLLGPIAVVAGLVAGLIHGSLEAASPDRSHISTGGASTTSTSVAPRRPGAEPDPVDHRGRRSPSPPAPPSSPPLPGPGAASTPDATAAGAALDDAGGGLVVEVSAELDGVDASVSASVSGPGASGDLGAGTGSDAGDGGAPGTPQDEDDCRHGGWADLVDDLGQPFPNQGQCVRWTEAHLP